MEVKESGEDYLETILILQNNNGRVRSVDVATEMHISKPSVSVAMKNLRSGGYIEMNDEHEISLTETGRELAEKIYERHVVFSEVLIKLGVDQTIARQDACRMEHALSSESFEALKRYFREEGGISPK